MINFFFKKLLSSCEMVLTCFTKHFGFTGLIIDYGISFYSHLLKIPNSYYVVTLTSHKNDFYIQVHDVKTGLKVRQAKLHNDHQVCAFDIHGYIKASL